MKGYTYRAYLLTMLVIITGLHYADTLAMAVASQSIKVSLNLSDAELGVLTGFAYVILFAILGVPIARWADTGNRVTVIAVTTAVWSIMVSLTGRAVGFTQLILARIGVGIGSAASFPTAQSLIPEYFSRAERPHATAVVLMSWPVALLLGYFVAGWLNELLGWREMFTIISVPGLGLAILARFTLREPRRTGSARPTLLLSTQPRVTEVISTLWRSPTYRYLLICFTIIQLFSAGLAQWQPAFFIRSFGMRSGAVGTGLAIALGSGSVVGIYSGGSIASRYAPNNERMQFRVMAGACIVCGCCDALAYVSPNMYWSFGLLGVGALVNAVYGPLLAAIQSLVPPRMRAMSAALIALFVGLIGSGLGPLAAGTLSDALHPIFGRDSLRYALLALSPGMAGSTWCLWRASKTVTFELAAMRGHQGRGGDSASFDASAPTRRGTDLKGSPAE